MRSRSQQPTISVAIRIFSWNERAIPRHSAGSGSQWRAGSKRVMAKWHWRKWSVISPSGDIGGTTQAMNEARGYGNWYDSFAAAFDESSRAVSLAVRLRHL